MGHYKEVDLSHVKKVLITIFKYQGDVLLTSPVYTALKRALPSAKIVVYLFKDTYPMLEGHPAIDEFLFFDQAWRKLPLPKRLWKELAMWRRVRKEKFDLTINLTSGDRGALVAKISGAPIRVGYESGGGMHGKDRFFTQLIRSTQKPRHIVERNLDALRAIGIAPKEEEKKLFFALTEGDGGLVPYDDFILVHPTSRCDYKHWPSSHFTELIKALRERGENVVLSGGPSLEERRIIEEIAAPLNDPAVLSIAGKTSLKQLGAVIQKAKLLISVDSVPPHIAAALERPTIVVFGPSDDVKWGPWRNPKGGVVRLPISCMRCDQEGCGGTWMSDCLQRLSVVQVLTACKAHLDFSF